MNETMNSSLRLSEALHGALDGLDADFLSLDDDDCAATIDSVSQDMFDDDKLWAPSRTICSAITSFPACHAPKIPTSIYIKGGGRAAGTGYENGGNDFRIESFPFAEQTTPSPIFSSLISLMMIPKSESVISNVEITAFQSSTGDPTRQSSMDGSAMISHSFLLHRLCMTYKVSLDSAKLPRLVQWTLDKDPECLLRRHVSLVAKAVQVPQTRQKGKRRIKAAYHYPLHMALANRNVPVPVIQTLLMVALQLNCCGGAADLLTLRDGRLQQTPLMILLKYRPHQVKLLDELILAAPASVALADRCNDTALHVAVRHGAGLVAIRHLVIVEPKTCLAENRLGETPLRIAQRVGGIPDGVVSFLAVRTHRFRLRYSGT
ncbi:hypothetical protein MPSEU_000544400 [Mayamaea pseudoterrestris]|nr:hypothetical protein MPSEU_000544400 [Mayamaea pseudoterrestris]